MPKQSTLRVGSGSLESGKFAFQPSQTTKDDSAAVDAQVDYSLENVNSVGALSKKPRLSTQSRVKSGLGLRVRPQLDAMGKSKQDLPPEMYLIDQSEPDHKAKSGLNIRRPMTSIQSYQHVPNQA